jgi:hypothetical protein
MSSERVYLHVPIAERPLAQLLGARWDREAQCWYVEQLQHLFFFSRWMPYVEGDELNVISEAASIAALDVPCTGCGRETEVICFHCCGGLVDGVPWRRFTCTAVEAVDTRVHTMLETGFPQLRLVQIPLAVDGLPAFVYMNHCVHCGAVIGQEYAQEHWEDPVNWTRREEGGGIRLIQILGTVRLGGGVTLID